jgi:DNA polymerase-1
MYRVEMDEVEAQRWIDQFYARYPRLRQWQQENYTRASRTGVIRSICGRPLRAEWEYGQLRWQKTCNFPVQSSAAAVMLLAMARVHAALVGLAAHMILQVHDELLIEATEDTASRAATIVEENMVAAYQELFPDAPVGGLVDVAIRKCWAKPEKK